MSVFLHYEGIAGESSDLNHQGWIDVESWSWGTERKITSNSSTRHDRESSNTTITDLIITRHMDSATPYLFIESCCGRGKTAVLRLTKTGSGAGADAFMEYTLKDAVISKYHVGGTSQDNKRPLEHIRISFIDIEMKYVAFDDDGQPQGPIAVGFDTSENKQH
ncbi:MAG: type VI secretion system tube protein Hcp [Ectothiorhodospiraceae bacterium]|nr:type VI secretion system tube protein Hcp [Ectothiorhodospiraceae bacterium]MCH8503984.1 type VI secretion system tube protein Hcp [Ectothiorhodospiraceae bacterium]